ncbi:hypothetical protein [Algiphilus sp.]|uniref:hypothetical protein n=1 Tax=Algiphilus sp. TaxID=1872431 RepID=UPI003CCC2E09
MSFASNLDTGPLTNPQPHEPHVPGPHWPDPTDADREAALTDLIADRMEIRLARDLDSRDGRDEVHDMLGDVLSVTGRLADLAEAVAGNDAAELGRILIQELRTQYEGIFGESAIERRAEFFRDQRIAKQRRERA